MGHEGAMLLRYHFLAYHLDEIPEVLGQKGVILIERISSVPLLSGLGVQAHPINLMLITGCLLLLEHLFEILHVDEAIHDIQLALPLAFGSQII
jgi:hypothetical protein